MSLWNVVGFVFLRQFDNKVTITIQSALAAKPAGYYSLFPRVSFLEMIDKGWEWNQYPTYDVRIIF